MRPLFTIHGGEYLTGLYIQQKLKLNVWIPAKDTGIDLLVTDPKNRRSVSVQVKYGKDFLTGKPAALRNKLRCLSWFTIRNPPAVSPSKFSDASPFIRPRALLRPSRTQKALEKVRIELSRHKLRVSQNALVQGYRGLNSLNHKTI